jgi:hypothetical protein
MTESETEKRSNLAHQIGPAIGAAIPEIVKIIHHSSTRREDGATPESDIDLTLILDNTFPVCTDVGSEILISRASYVLDQFKLKLGTGPMRVHLTPLSTKTVTHPEKYVRDIDSLKVLMEILTKGEVVYTRGLQGK